MRKRKHYMNQRNLFHKLPEKMSEESNKLNNNPKRQTNSSKNNQVSYKGRLKIMCGKCNECIIQRYWFEPIFKHYLAVQT